MLASCLTRDDTGPGGSAKKQGAMATGVPAGTPQNQQSSTAFRDVQVRKCYTKK